MLPYVPVCLVQQQMFSQHAGAMLNELPKRYKYERRFPLPVMKCNGESFRNKLLSLLYCEPIESSYNIALYQLSLHFNGDISRSDEWVHYCSGDDCCKNLQHSLSKDGVLSFVAGIMLHTHTDYLIYLPIYITNLVYLIMYLVLPTYLILSNV